MDAIDFYRANLTKSRRAVVGKRWVVDKAPSFHQSPPRRLSVCLRLYTSPTLFTQQRRRPEFLNLEPMEFAIMSQMLGEPHLKMISTLRKADSHYGDSWP